MPQSEVSNNEQSADGMATVSDLNDQDVMIQYCLTNKVNKIAIDELLKRGFESLEALKLVTMEDMSSVNIPMGQRRLIFHIAQALNPADSTSGSSGSKTMTTTSVEGNTGIPLTASGVSTGNISIPTTVAGGSAGASLPLNQPAVPSVAVGQLQQQPLSQDIYNQTLLNTLLTQQAQIASAGQSSVSVNTQHGNSHQGLQPMWSDPQVHIASATGKSTSAYYDICDFVAHSLEEEVVVGGQGEQQLVIKAGPKKPRLESLTLSQWSVANLAILYKLANKGKLGGPSLMDYLSYTTKVYQLVQKYSLVSVLLYDREYRKLQGAMNFRWGTDVQHLHTLFLQPRANSGTQGVPANALKKAGSHFPVKPKGDKRFEICRNFNSEKGCSYEQCRFKHKCIVPGCSQGHPATAHSQEKK